MLPTAQAAPVDGKPCSCLPKGNGKVSHRSSRGQQAPLVAISTQKSGEAMSTTDNNGAV